MNVQLFYQPLVESAQELARDASKSMESWGHTVDLKSILEPLDDVGRDVDLVVTFGGDGSILRSTHLSAPCQVPVLGVNLGRVGFLSEIGPDDLPDGLRPYLEGKAFVEERALVEATVKDGERKFVNLQESPSPASLPLIALNEVFVGRGAIGRLVKMTVRVDGTTIGDYRADGLIVASPTGSTAYGLASGGPVIGPDVEALVLVAVSAQANPVNSLVLPASAVVEITVRSDHAPVLSSDGLFDVALESGDTVVVRQSLQKGRFLRRGRDGNFYDRLLERLR